MADRKQEPKNNSDTPSAAIIPPSVHPPEIVSEAKHESIHSRIVSSSEFAIATLPTLKSEERKELIAVIDKDNERQYKYQRRRQTLSTMKFLLITLLIAAIIFVLIFNKEFSFLENLFTLVVPIIAAAFGGGGYVIIRYFNQRR